VFQRICRDTRDFRSFIEDPRPRSRASRSWAFSAKLGLDAGGSGFWGLGVPVCIVFEKRTATTELIKPAKAAGAVDTCGGEAFSKSRLGRVAVPFPVINRPLIFVRVAEREKGSNAAKKESRLKRGSLRDRNPGAKSALRKNKWATVGCSPLRCLSKTASLWNAGHILTRIGGILGSLQKETVAFLALVLAIGLVQQ